MFSALNNRNYRWFMISGTAQSAGFMMQQFTMAWLLLELTDSVSQLGFMVFLQGLPMMASLLFVGVVADRMDRRKLLMLSQVLLMVNVVALGTLTITDTVAVWHIYTAAVVSGLGRGFNAPTRLTLIRELVDRKDVMNAVTVNFILMTVSMLVGPLVAGPVIQWVGIGQSFYFTAACYLTASLTLLYMRGLTSSHITSGTSAVRDLVEGVRYMGRSSAVFSILILGFAIAFFGQPVMQLLPAFGRDVLELGPFLTSMLLAIMAAGALTGNIALAAMGDAKNKTRLFLGSIVLFSISLTLFAVSPWTALSMALLFFVGMGTLTFVSMGTTVLQLLVPREMMGRVMGVWTMGASFVSLGALPIGVLGDAVGLRAAFFGGAMVCLASFFVFGVLRSSIRQAPIHEESAARVPDTAAPAQPMAEAESLG
jgi:MFS family permease